MLDLDNAFHRRAFELCGMEEHFDHMLSTFQPVSYTHLTGRSSQKNQMR